MTAPRPATRLLTPAEAGTMLGCSGKTVYRLITDGKLRATDIGRGRSRTRVREDDLTAYINSHTRLISA